MNHYKVVFKLPNGMLLTHYVTVNGNGLEAVTVAKTELNISGTDFEIKDVELVKDKDLKHYNKR